ncbi:DNA-binding transcriptional MerR regulator [Acinetobacter calcoaceticus]|uniref:DNA-binding transcriptional MerR regulator n=1 Tax=Acinetobacter calcoaceticus TaxID=471 RepID=A0A4R1XPZ1_ACICA|nr:DNA-binding transcriptional MerR regulator [Acinetobacter calcoaceticus]
MNLAKVSLKTGVSHRMLRHYEALGLITPQRRANNYREYSEFDIAKINKIQILNQAGIPLKQIHEFLACFNLNDKSFVLCPIVANKIHEQKKLISEQIDKLNECYEMLDSFLQKQTKID